MNGQSVTLGREIKDHLSKSPSCTDEETEVQRSKCLAKITVSSTNRSGTLFLRDWNAGSQMQSRQGVGTIPWESRCSVGLHWLPVSPSVTGSAGGQASGF